MRHVGMQPASSVTPESDEGLQGTFETVTGCRRILACNKTSAKVSDQTRVCRDAKECLGRAGKRQVVTEIWRERQQGRSGQKVDIWILLVLYSQRLGTSNRSSMTTDLAFGRFQKSRRSDGGCCQKQIPQTSAHSLMRRSRLCPPSKTRMTLIIIHDARGPVYSCLLCFAWLPAQHFVFS